VTIKTWLDGDRPDLEELTRLLADGPVRVSRDAADDAYYLTAAEIDNAADDRYAISAQALLTTINGLARARNPGFRPVRLAGKYTMPDGHTHHHADAHLEFRASLAVGAVGMGPDGQPQPQPPSPWAGYLAAASSSPAVARVLAIMGRDENHLAWAELYKIYELVGRAVAPDTIVSRGWATNNEGKAFTASASRPDVSGDTARHAVAAGAVPKRTMTIEQARSFISALVTKWLANP
jgi:hypothetical protein